LCYKFLFLFNLFMPNLALVFDLTTFPTGPHGTGKAYAYLRVSTASQQSGHGLVRQKQDCQRTAATLGLQLDDADIMVDMASAYTGQNLAAGKLGKFIDDVEAGQIPNDVTLIVESVDRLSRQGIKDSLPLLFKLHKLGLRLYVIEQSQFFDADLLSTIVAAVNLERAQNESKLKSVRMQAVWAAKANSCAAPITAKSPSWVELLPDRSGFRLIPEKAAVVRRAYELALKGLGTDKIISTFRDEGILSFSGSATWPRSSMNRLLTNSQVIGHFEPHRKVDGKRISRDVTHEAYYPVVVSEGVFYKVQAGRRRRRQVSQGRPSRNGGNLFTGIVKCGACGNPMHYKSYGSGPRGYAYLRCSAHVNGSCFASTPVRYDEFEADFIQQFETPSWTTFLAADDDPFELGRLERDVDALKLRLVHLENGLDRINRMLMDGSVVDDAVAPLIRKNHEDRQKLKAQIADKQAELASASATASVTTSSATELAELAKRLLVSEPNSAEFRRQVRQRLIETVKSIMIFTDGDNSLQPGNYDTSDRQAIRRMVLKKNVQLKQGQRFTAVQSMEGQWEIVIPKPKLPRKVAHRFYAAG
jgi:DNA invertase Pin-like site-specific DNA recombinase